MSNGTDLFDIDHLRGIVLRHDAELSELAGVAELVGRQGRQLDDQKVLLNTIYEMVAAWREDSKVMRIADLTGQVHLKERVIMLWQRLAVFIVGVGAVVVAALVLHGEPNRTAQMGVGGGGLFLMGWALKFFRERGKSKDSLPPSKP